MLIHSGIQNIGKSDSRTTQVMVESHISFVAANSLQ